jgi:hypothetical protein
MVRFSDLPTEIQQAFNRITPLSFGIVGKSLDGGEPWAVGSGVFIAPYIALTARHVVEVRGSNSSQIGRRASYRRRRSEQATFWS